MTFSPYPQLTEAPTSWLEKYPSHWSVVPLWSLFRRGKQTGYPDERLLSVYREYGVIPTDSRDDNANRPSEDLSAYQLVEPGDLAINKMKAWQGSVAISGLRGIVSPAYFIFKPNHGHNPRYLHHLFRSRNYIDGYLSISKGIRVNQWDLDPEKHRVMPVLLPKPDEQDAIVAFIDRETVRIDSLINRKSRFVELLTERKSAVVNNAVTKGIGNITDMKPSGESWIGDIPAHWQVKPLRAFFNFRNEKNDPIKTTNILSLSIASGVTLYSEEGRGGNKRKDDLAAYKIAHKGDIVLNSMNVIVGAVGRSDFHGAISPVYYALYPRNNDVFVPYFEKIFMNSGFQKGLLRFGKGILMKISGTGQMNTIRMKISQDDLKTVAFPVPPLDEQRQIADYLDTEVSRTDDLIAKTMRSIELLKEKRAALITAAVTGKIDVRNAA